MYETFKITHKPPNLQILETFIRFGDDWGTFGEIAQNSQIFHQDWETVNVEYLSWSIYVKICDDKLEYHANSWEYQDFKWTLTYVEKYTNTF